MVIEILTIPLVHFLSLTSPKLLPFTFIATASVCTPTCYQGALCRALLHEHHVLKQWTVRAVPARSRSGLGQVGGQVAAGEEGRAEGEGRLQADVLLGRRHLDGRQESGEGRADGEKDVFYEFCREKKSEYCKEKKKKKG